MKFNLAFYRNPNQTMETNALSFSIKYFYSVSFYYEFSKEQDYICSKPEDSGMHKCADLPPYRIGPLICNGE
jgi:hypothetical protein